MPQTALIVPARLASTRFPRKLLHPVQGKPLILHTAERLRTQAPELPLWFAVGDAELAEALQAEGYQSVLTDSGLPSGTDRLAAANHEIGADIVVNVQADEPLIEAAHIHALLERLEADPDASIATLAMRFKTVQDYRDPNKVKVVVGQNERALYFTRAAIPYARDTRGEIDAAWLAQTPVYWHMGLYAYRKAFLQTFTELPPTPLEQSEKLEQLRALEHGHALTVGITDKPTLGIDTPEDADAFAALLRQG